MLMDGRSINLPVDSSSTSKEICQLLSSKVKLKDTFGFSVYVALYEKVRSRTRPVYTLLCLREGKTQKIFGLVDIYKAVT